MLQGTGQNQKWPTSGPSGYMSPAVLGVPDASQRRTKLEVAHNWAHWLHNSCCWGGGGGNASERGTKSEVAHKWDGWLHNPCCWGGGGAMLQSGAQNQKWPTNGPDGYITLAICGVPHASKQGTKSEVAHKWAQCLHNPYHLGDPLCFKARDKIRSGPQAGLVAT